MTVLEAETRSGVEVEGLKVSAYEVPTETQPESDGTLEWDSTTLVLVEAEGGGRTGIGYTYASRATAAAVESTLADAVARQDAMRPGAAWAEMQRQARNAGRPGAMAMAISAVDIALWDLKARHLEVSLADLLPRFREGAPVYGSGGFTSYTPAELRSQAEGWHEAGFASVKIKVGRDPAADPERLRIVRDVVGPDVELMVDANGAWTRREALAQMELFRSEFDVTYVEEPLTSEDLEGLRLLRDRGPAGMAVAAGEYAWDLSYVRGLLEAEAVDVMQADATRVGGVTNMLRADGLCKARHMPFSAHCAPAVSAHVCCAMETLEHIEYFHDHVRIERMLFDGTLEPDEGCLVPDGSRPGLGLELNRDHAERFRL
jgi:L-alanine-DL-glutamate epimerase-like enolase superfamily enzyme